MGLDKWVTAVVETLWFPMKSPQSHMLGNQWSDGIDKEYAMYRVLPEPGQPDSPAAPPGLQNYLYVPYDNDTCVRAAP